jgi:hypothetical protein
MQTLVGTADATARHKLNSRNERSAAVQSTSQGVLFVGRYYLDPILVAAFVAPRLEFVVLG